VLPEEVSQLPERRASVADGVFLRRRELGEGGRLVNVAMCGGDEDGIIAEALVASWGFEDYSVTGPLEPGHDLAIRVGEAHVADEPRAAALARHVAQLLEQLGGAVSVAARRVAR